MFGNWTSHSDILLVSCFKYFLYVPYGTVLFMFQQPGFPWPAAGLPQWPLQQQANQLQPRCRQPPSIYYPCCTTAPPGHLLQLQQQQRHPLHLYPDEQQGRRRRIRRRAGTGMATLHHPASKEECIVAYCLNMGDDVMIILNDFTTATVFFFFVFQFFYISFVTVVSLKLN